MKSSVSLTLVLFGSLLVVPSAGARVKPRDTIDDLTPSDELDLAPKDTAVEEELVEAGCGKTSWGKTCATGCLRACKKKPNKTCCNRKMDATQCTAAAGTFCSIEVPKSKEYVFPCYDWEESKAGKKKEHDKEQCTFDNYYKDVDVTSAEELHEKIKGQTILPYSAFASHNTPAVNEARAPCADVWKSLEFLDQSQKPCGPESELSGPCDTNATLNVDLLYSKHPVEKSSPSEKGPVRVWNREHVWPKSYGASCKKKRKDWKKKCKRGKCKYVKCKVQKKYTESNGPFTDVHHLFPSHTDVNSDRGSQYFQQCEPGECNYEHHQADGYTAADEDAGESRDDRTFWQPPGKSRGVVARSLLYMALRYNGDEANTFDLTVTDHPSYCNDALGKLSSLLKWHKAFPPTQAERDRNEKACWLQGNRNPFVDHPELVEKLFGGDNPSEKLVSLGGTCQHKSPRAHVCETDPDADMVDLCIIKPKPECTCGGR